MSDLLYLLSPVLLGPHCGLLRLPPMAQRRCCSASRNCCRLPALLPDTPWRIDRDDDGISRTVEQLNLVWGYTQKLGSYFCLSFIALGHAKISSASFFCTPSPPCLEIPFLYPCVCPVPVLSHLVPLQQLGLLQVVVDLLLLEQHPC